MKKVFAVFLLYVCHAAYAQSVYSFADLNWGDTPEKVDQILKQKGFSGIPFLAQKKCAFMSECMVNFDGPSVINGYAFFHGGVLDRITVITPKRSDLEKLLVEKYGLPQQVPIERTGSENFLARINDKWWRAQNGEGLKLYSDNEVDYLSKRALDYYYQNPLLQKSNF